MSIRWKLLIPTIALWAVLISVFNFVWVPASLEESHNYYKEQQHRRLTVFMMSLVEPLLQSNLSQINITIDSIIEQNDSWKMLVLRDIHGRRLYPLGEQGQSNSHDLITITSKLDHLGTTLAEVELIVDPSSYLESHSRLTHQLNIFLLMLLAVGITVALLIQDILVRKPIQRLVDASNKLANGEFDSDLPRESNDEFGQLLASLRAANANSHHMLSELEDEAFVARESSKAWRVIEERHRAVLDNVADGIVITDTSGKILSVNPAMCNILDYEEEDLLGENVKKLMPEYHSNQHDSYMKRYLDGGRRKIIGQGSREITGKRRDGTGIALEMTLGDMQCDKDRMFIAVVRDITERKIAEKALRAERDRAQRYLDNVEVMILSLDKECNLGLVNRKGCEILGYQQQDLFGKSWFDMCIIKTQRDELRKHYEMALAGEEMLLEYYEGPVITKGGNIAIIAWHNSLLVDENGNILGILSSGQDITDQRVAEKDRQEMRMQLQQAQKMEAIGQLTGGIAHDFNNMLASIMGYTELAMGTSNERSDIKINQYLGEIYRSGERARDLIAKMLAFSRGKEANETGSIQLAPTLTEILTMMKSVIPSSIEIRNDVLTNISPIQFSTIDLQQAIMNLCINARDAMDGKGKIELHSRSVILDECVCTSCHEKINGEYVELAVKDNGPGISHDIIERLFEPFFTTKEVDKGTGMGLSVVHGVMHQNHGHIRVESKQGIGSTFRLFFRVASTERKKDLSNEYQDYIQKDTLFHRHANILLVDNNSSENSSIRELLEEHGYFVKVISDTYQAYMEFKENPEQVDIVIADQAMPKLSGTELAGAILSIRPEIPVILMAEDNSSVNEEEVKSCGIRVCKKPINAECLLHVLHDIQGMADDYALSTVHG